MNRRQLLLSKTAPATAFASPWLQNEALRKLPAHRRKARVATPVNHGAKDWKRV
jgi:hypothetical protein